MRTLKEFVEAELQKRDISISEFARKVGVGKTTIINILNEKSDYPHISTLVALAGYTGVSVSTLFNLAVGLDAEKTEAIVLAYRIMQLPPDKQKLLMEILSGTAFKQADSSS